MEQDRLVLLQNYLPFWSDLKEDQKKLLQNAVVAKEIPKGVTIHNGQQDCIGLLVVLSGQLRVFVLSEEGKEITLYRLFERDMCLFSASCIMHSIQFELQVQTAEDTNVLVIPPNLYQNLMRSSLPIANYTNDLMASRFSDVMWLLDQVLNKSFDGRLAAFLLEESSITGSPTLHITQESIAHHLGSAREVVTRMLKYFQMEGMVELFRGGLRIKNTQALEALAVDSLK